MSEEQPPKPNGTGNDPMKRLASLKPTRDLSLGGVKPNKKIFTPNLNVARNKNKGPSTSGVQQSKRDDKNQRDRKNDRNKNANRGSKVIKSTGVFSEGLGSVERSYVSRGSYSRDADPAPAMQKPTIRVKDVVKIDKELEEQKIRSVMGDIGDTDSGDAIADFTKTTERDAPIKLPMGHRSVSKPAKVKEEVIVKDEPNDDELTNGEPKVQIPESIKSEPYEESEVVDLLRKKDPTLILLQLPDTLPGRGGGRDDEGPRQKGNKHNETNSTGNTETTDEKPQAESGCYLSDLEEGRIGTIRTHRSGRVTLLLGDTVFEVNMGTTPSFQQELVSVAHDDNSRSASLVSLGAVKHCVNVVPQWETMMKHLDL